MDHSDLEGFIFSRGKVLRELELDIKAPTFTAAVQAQSLRSVAFDAPEDALVSIRAGHADLVIAQRQFDWGYAVVNLAYDMVVDGRREDAFHGSGWYSVCPNDIDQYTAMWQERDFRGELPACELFE